MASENEVKEKNSNKPSTKRTNSKRNSSKRSDSKRDSSRRSDSKRSSSRRKYSRKKKADEYKIGPWGILKKIILIMILVTMGLYVAQHEEQFWVDKRHYVEYSPDSGTVDLQQVSEVDQEFIARDRVLRNVTVVFTVKDKTKNQGNVIVELKDNDGNVMASASCASKDIVQFRHLVKTQFVMNDTKLNVGETYHIVIHGENLNCPEGIYLVASNKKGNLYKTLKLDGVEQDNRIKMSFNMLHYEGANRRNIFIILAISILFILIPMEKVQKTIDKKLPGFKLNRWLSRLFFILAPVVSFFIVQRYCDYNVADFMEMLVKYRGRANLVIYALILWGLFILFNRTKYAASLTVLISSILGLANHYVWNFRGSPVMMADLGSWRTAGQVAGEYNYDLDFSAMFAMTVTLAFICMLLSLRNYKGFHWKMRICAALAVLIPLSIYARNILDAEELKSRELILNVWNPSGNYAELGCALSFYMSYTYYTVEKPEDYSLDQVKNITAGYESDSAADSAKKNRPNVICIMNETFSDLNVLGDAQTTEDVMPFIHSLKENTIKGNLYMSVLGGNTANSEFEFLTGCTMSFLPFRAISYENYIKGEFPSLTQSMVSSGYCGNIAIHPGERTAWNRDKVYPNFGFSTFYSKWEMGQVELLRGWVSDQCDYNFLTSKYEETRQSSKDPYYAFNVTIQNHGGYLEKYADNLVMNIKFKDDGLNEYEEPVQYVNLIKHSDDAFKNLVEYYSKVDEPTVIVFFGDHLPNLPEEFYEVLLGKESEDFTIEDIMKEYTVPYVIWANYDIEEQENVNMSANYLSAYLMQTIGGNMTGYQKWLMDLRKELPVITANGYQGKDGVWHSINEESEYSKFINQYQILQYNNMIDTKKRYNEIYYLKE